MNEIEQYRSAIVYHMLFFLFSLFLFGNSQREQVTAKTDLSTDPTYPRAKRPCPKCGYPEAVFFQSRAKRADTSMKLFFACASGSCNHRWVD